MKRISVAHRFKDRAPVASLVRGIAFALITLLFTTVAFFKGFLWCIYIGFSLTMAFGAKNANIKITFAAFWQDMCGRSPMYSFPLLWKRQFIFLPSPQ